MKRFLSFVFLLSLPFVLSSCMDKLNANIGEDGLPHGENALYYYIDGRLVIPKTKWAGEGWIYAISYSHCYPNSANAGGLVIYDSEGLDMFISDLRTGRHDFYEANFPLCDNPNGTSAYLFIEEMDTTGNLAGHYYYTRTGAGYIDLDYVSPDKRRLRGTFEMTVYCDENGRERHITDGHFNLNLDKLHGY